MLICITIAILSQLAPTKVCDPTVNSNCAPVSNASPSASAYGLNVRVVSQPASGAASAQGLSNDGGYAWHVDLERVGGVAANVGTGAAGTGTLRVATASDSSLTCNAGTNLNTSALALDATLTGGTQKAIARSGAKGASVAADVTSTANGVDHQGLDVQVQNASIAVTGTVTTTPPSNASTNVAQFGGSNAVTGTGTSGAGIPRVTLSNDSSLAANQSVNVAQINGVAPLMGVGASGTGAQRVASLLHDGTTTVGVIASTTALKTDLSSVAGTATATGNGTAAGSIRVSVASDSTGTIAATQSGAWTDRVVGNAGAALDAVNNAAPPANVLVQGLEAQSSALSASATAGNVRRGIVGLDGVQYVREGGPLLFTGGVTAIAATLTQVVAAPAAGTSLYLTDVMAMSDTATAGNFLIRYGTGSNCVTGTTSIYPSSVSVVKSMYPGNASAPLMLNFHTPLKIPAANALCILCVATNTCTAQFWGYTAP